MRIVRKSRRGIDYLAGVLRETKQTMTRVVFWRIPHATSGRDEINLKIGRYNRPKTLLGKETLSQLEPRSELTLDDEEFGNLIRFLDENYEPFRAGERRYIPVAEQVDTEAVVQLRRILERQDTLSVVNLVLEHNLLSADVMRSLELRTRHTALREFEAMLAGDRREQDWQVWLETNDWVFGTDFVQVVDERRIDTANIADYLVEAYDGFLDIIEIKRPEGGLKFWSDSRDHGNLVPAADLVKAITQTSRYLYEIEREANSAKFLARVGVRTVKPRATLIFGRSDAWGDDEREAYRILNRSYHDLTILTYDHVLDRARRMLASREKDEAPRGEEWDDVPF